MFRRMEQDIRSVYPELVERLMPITERNRLPPEVDNRNGSVTMKLRLGASRQASLIGAISPVP